LTPQPAHVRAVREAVHNAYDAFIAFDRFAAAVLADTGEDILPEVTNGDHELLSFVLRLATEVVERWYNASAPF